jgi:hypothetical protein
MKIKLFRMKICGVLLFSLFVLNGCATIGHDFAFEQVPNVQIGKTTQAQVQAMFGLPWRTGVEDGKQTWTYGKYYYSLFSETSAQDLVVRFDNNGIVTSYTYNTTEPTSAK